jgi:hypothetical protein
MLIEKEVSCNEEKFFIQSLLVYIKKPQLVNKKLSHSKTLLCIKINECDDENLIFEDFKKKFSTRERNQNNEDLSGTNQVDIKDVEECEHGKYVIVTKIEPRDTKKFKSRIIGIILGRFMDVLMSSYNIFKFVLLYFRY